MNKTILLGNLVKDIELKATQSGVSVTNFTIAVKRNYKNQNNEYETDFINCVAMKGTAEILSKFTKKGSKIALEGSIRVRNYEDKQGVKKYATEVFCERVELLDSKKESGRATQTSYIAEEVDNIKTENDPFAQMGNKIEEEQQELEFDESQLPF